MRQLTPQEKEQLDTIEAMIMKNFKLMAEWAFLPIKERLKQSAHIKGLIKRTDILIKCKEDFKKVIAESEDK